MSYKTAKRIMEKHEVTLFDKITGTLFFPILIFTWYKIGKKENIGLLQCSKDYFKILFK